METSASERFSRPKPPEGETGKLTTRQELKLDIFTHGIKPTDAARQAIQGIEGRPLTTGDYVSTDGVILDVGENIIVNAPFPDNNPFAEDTEYIFDYKDGSFWVQKGDGERIEAKHLPPPAYINEENQAGRRYGKIVSTHSDRVRVSPIDGCALACHFCNVPYEFRKYTRIPAEELVDAVQVAIDDPIRPAQHLLISGGTPRPEDFPYLKDVYEKMAQAFPGLDIDVMMTPSSAPDGSDLLDLRRLKELGIHSLSINMELYNREIAARVMRGKHDIGREQYLKFLEKAVSEFGVGSVRSMLMLGIESVEETLKAVELLAERGVCPELSPFRPDPSTPMRANLPPSLDEQKRAYFGTHEILDKYNRRYERKLNDGLQCIDCMHNVTMVPGENSYRPHYDKKSRTTTYEYPLRAA